MPAAIAFAILMVLFIAVPAVVRMIRTWAAAMQFCTTCATPLADRAAYCAACGTAVGNAAADTPLGAALAQASRLQASGEVDQAIALLSPFALRPEPDPQATFALGAACLQRGRYADALPLLAGTVERLPDHARAHAYLGMAYLHTYQPAEARAALDTAVALAPDDFVVNLKHGEMLIRLGYFRESLAPLERALAGPAPDGATLAFAQRLKLYARQKAPNTFTRSTARLPRFAWPQRRTPSAQQQAVESQAPGLV